MENARQILNRLQREGMKISELERKTILTAALLHDLGHGPISHLFEKLTGIHHGKLTMDFIKSPTTQVNKILTDAHPTLPNRIEAFYTQHTHPLASMVSGVFDVDRLDYLQRDLLSSALTPKKTMFDAKKLLHGLKYDATLKRLYFTEDLIPELEKFIQTRTYAYRTLSYSSEQNSADKMTIILMQRIKRLTEQKYKSLNDLIPGSAEYLNKLLHKQDDLEQYIKFDDSSMHELIKNAAMTAKDPIVKRLAQGVLHGNLYEARLFPYHQLDGINDLIAKKTKTLNDPDLPDLITTITKKITPYPTTVGTDSDIIWIKSRKTGQFSRLRDASSTIRMLAPESRSWLVFDKSQLDVAEDILQSAKRIPVPSDS
jgi:uncharacterized protein